jgi:hypothetical protein
MGSLLGSWCDGAGARAPGAWWRRPAVVRAFNARVREQACACGAPSSEAEPAGGRSRPSSEAESARGKRAPSNRAEPARGRRAPSSEAEPARGEACALERGGACSRGSLSGPSWWSVGATAAWALPCVFKWGALSFGSSWVLSGDSPVGLRGPLGLSPTLISGSSFHYLDYPTRNNWVTRTYRPRREGWGRVRRWPGPLSPCATAEVRLQAPLSSRCATAEVQRDPERKRNERGGERLCAS